MPPTTTSGRLSPRPPFAFDQTLAFLSGFRPLEGEQALTERSLTRALLVDGQVLAIQLEDAGGVERPGLAYRLLSEAPLTAGARRAALDRVTAWLGLEDDLTDFYTVGRADPPFAPLVDRLYGYHQVRFPTPFEAAVWALLSQRNPMAIARRLKGRLTERYGGSVVVDGQPYAAFPEAAHLAAVDPAELVALLRNEARAVAIAGAAAAFGQVDEGWLRAAPYEEVDAWLRAIRGIGPWSASFILLRGLGRTERLPSGESRLEEAAARVYGPLDPAQLARLAEPYGRWRGYWAHYLRVGA